jgi:3-oxoacyl-[acyl-carrier protein] reductase
MTFDGARVVVTGGTNGIGRGLVDAFLEAGARVTVTGTNGSLSDYPDQPEGVVYHRLELTEPGSIDAFAATLTDVDVLVNNAGASLPGGRDEWEPDVFAEAVTINLTAGFRLSVACRDRLAASTFDGGGNIVNLASMASYFGVPMVPGYGAAKAGVVQMTKTLAVHWAPLGIRVNAVAPGLIESNMTAPMKVFTKLADPTIERTPMKRWGTPADVAGPVLFLASGAAAFVTGQTLAVDGGYSAA